MKKTIRVLVATEEKSEAKIYKNVLFYVPISIKQLLAQQSTIEIIEECKDAKQAIEIAERIIPDVVMIDYHIPPSGCLDVIKELLNMNPKTLILVVDDKMSKVNMKEVMKVGARGYVVKPLSAKEISKVIIDLYEQNQEGAREKQEQPMEIREEKEEINNKKEESHQEEGAKNTLGKEVRNQKMDTQSKEQQNIQSKIITLFSTKGGVGKSTIAINLAVALAQNKGKRVVIIDLDLQAGDVAIMMNLYPKRTIADLARNQGDLDEELLEGHLQEHFSGVKVLAAPQNLELWESVTSYSIEEIINILSKTYDYILIDTSCSFTDINLTALDLTDYILLITTQDLTSIRNIRSNLQILKKLEYNHDKIHLILNQYSKEADITPKEIEKITEQKIKVIIPKDDTTAIHAANTGTPFVIENASKILSKRMIEIAELF